MGIQLITSLFIVGKLVSKTLLFNLWFCVSLVMPESLKKAFSCLHGCWKEQK